MSNFDLDNILDNWTEEVNKEIEKNDFDTKTSIEKYKKEHKLSVLVGKIRFFLIGVMIVCLFPQDLTPSGIIVNLYIFGMYLYLSSRYNKFYKRLDGQDFSETVSNFLDHRKEILTETLTSLKDIRPYIYPASVAIMVLNLYKCFERFEGVWFAVAIIFTLGAFAWLIHHIESSIKELNQKIESFN